MILLALIVLFIIIRILPGQGLSSRQILYCIGGVLGMFVLLFSVLIVHDQIDYYLHPNQFNMTLEQIHDELQDTPVVKHQSKQKGLVEI